MQTRAEWQAEKDEEHKRNGTWGFDPGMPWRIAHWNERLGICLFYGIMWGAVFPALLIGGLYVLGTMGEGITRYNVEHDRCLKHANNGYDIRQCR